MIRKEINLNTHLKKKLKQSFFFFQLNLNLFPDLSLIQKIFRHYALLFSNIPIIRNYFWPKPTHYSPFDTSPTKLPFGNKFKKISQLFFRCANAPHQLTLNNIPRDIDIRSIEYIANMFRFTKKENTTFINQKVSPMTSPLVSILIPAHRKEFLLDALNSAQQQTYPNIEIIVSDDSDSNDIQLLIESYDFDKIQYLRSPNLNAPAMNHIHLIKHANGELIKFLNDDDLLKPTCIEKMTHALQTHSNIGFITSARIFVDEQLNELYTNQLLKESTIINRNYFIKLIYLYGNIIGEPTTTLFKKELLINQHFPSIFKVFNHYKYKGFPGDIRIWLTLLLQSDLIYLNEPLSIFRQHKHQGQKKPDYIKSIKTGHRILQKIIEDLGLFHVSGPKNVILPL